MKRFTILLLALWSTVALAGDRIIYNPDSDGDVKIRVNDGGTVKDAIKATGATNSVTIGGDNATSPHVVQLDPAPTTTEFGVAAAAGSRAIQIRNAPPTNFVDPPGSSRFGTSLEFLPADGTVSTSAAVYNYYDLTNNRNNLVVHSRSDVHVTSGSGGHMARFGAGGSEILLHTDGSCGIGNICSGSFTSVSSDTTNVTVASIAAGQYLRVGNVVHYGFKLEIDPGSSADFSFEITVPQTVANFSNNDQGTGVCTVASGSGSANDPLYVRAVSGKQELMIVNGATVTDVGQAGVRCIMTYQLQ